MRSDGRPLPTQAQLIIRIVVGLYLEYLSYSLCKGHAESSMNPIVLWVFIAIFVIVGIVFIAISITAYLRGEYKGGKADVDEEESDIVSELMVERDSDNNIESVINDLEEVADVEEATNDENEE